MKVSTRIMGVGLAIGLGLLSMSAHAASSSQSCTLGSACALSADSRLSFFPVSSDTGTSYQCTITADAGSDLWVALSGSGRFRLVSGPTAFHVSPGASISNINIEGTFKDSACPVSQINFVRAHGTGSVTCSPVGAPSFEKAFGRDGAGPIR